VTLLVPAVQQVVLVVQVDGGLSAELFHILTKQHVVAGDLELRLESRAIRETRDVLQHLLRQGAQRAAVAEARKVRTEHGQQRSPSSPVVL